MIRFSTPQELDVLAGICRAVKKTPDAWASQRWKFWKRDTIFTHFWRELKRDLICFPHNKMDMSSLDIYLLSQVGGLSVCQTRQLALKIWTCVGFKYVCVCICEGCVLFFCLHCRSYGTLPVSAIDGRLVCPSPVRAGMDACVNWINPG